MPCQSRALSTTAGLIVILSWSWHLNAADNKNADDLETCPHTDMAPLVHRKSIAISRDHFGEGTMDQYPEVVILRLHGTPFEMGFQHGSMLKDEIKQRLSKAEAKRERSNSLVPLSIEKMFFMTRTIMVWPKQARREIKGMARGSGFPARDLVWLNMMDESAQMAGYENVPHSKAAYQKAPAWIIVFYHGEGQEKAAAIIRPGSMRDRALWCDAECPGPHADASQQPCEIMIECLSEDKKIIFDRAKGLICISSDQGESFGAVDLMDQKWRPGCGLCP